MAIEMIKHINSIKYKKTLFQKIKEKDVVKKINAIIDNVNNVFTKLSNIGGECAIEIRNKLDSQNKQSEYSSLSFKSNIDAWLEFSDKFEKEQNKHFVMFKDYLKSLTTNPKLTLKEIEQQINKYLWSKSEKEIFYQINLAIKPKVLKKQIVEKYLKMNSDNLNSRIEDKLIKVKTRLLDKFDDFVKEIENKRRKKQDDKYNEIKVCLRSIGHIIEKKSGKLTKIDLETFENAFKNNGVERCWVSKLNTDLFSMIKNSDIETKKTLLTLINMEIDNNGKFFFNALESYIFEPPNSK